MGFGVGSRLRPEREREAGEGSKADLQAGLEQAVLEFTVQRPNRMMALTGCPYRHTNQD
ncbi:MAG: hypothetical protein NTZ11_02100 [Gammaproteobacteria bacterium]|nr:hypothetical protein [Gammaproteobacteria bacterium]